MLDCRLEMITMCGNDPVRVLGSFDEFNRHCVAGVPKVHGAIINSEGAAKNFRARISSISVRTHLFQDSLAAGLIITVQDVLRRRNAAGCYGVRKKVLGRDLQH